MKRILTSKKNIPLLSFVLNVYNEEKNVENTYRECRKILRNAKIPYEIIFVEGGSRDNSWKVLQKLERNHSDCKAIQSEMEPGRKVNAGMKIARGKYYGYMCSDGQDNPNVLPRFIKLLEENKADFVKARRINRSTWQRKFISRTYNLFLRILFGFKLIDVNMHPKVFRGELVKGIDLISKSESIDLEIALRARKKGYRTIEIPVRERVRAGGKSSVNIKVAVKMAMDMLSYKWGDKGRLLDESYAK
jgi:glycosyltransferase involved in cell wall biosynthesis